MPVQKGQGCVGREMELFHKGQLHSGKGGKVVTDPKQAKAIALSACGESKYSEQLQSMGFPASVADEVVAMFAEMDWDKEFKTGKKPAPENPENYHTGEVYAKSPAAAKMAKTGVKGDNGWKQKDVEPEMLSPVAYPKQKADWDNPPSRQLNGLQMLG